MNVRVPAPVSGGLVLSYRCTAECLHCMYACTPRWEGGWITTECLASILAQLAETIQPSPAGPDAIGVSHGLHFTGGEPFLNFDLLCSAVGLADDFGIPSTFAETNCFWCVSDRVTREKLALLKDKGLKGILISVNPFYLEYVPFEFTERAVRIALEMFGPNVVVYQIEYFRRFLRLGIKGKVPLDEYLKSESAESLFRNVEFFLSGRAAFRLAKKMGDFFARNPARRFFRERCRPEFLRGWHNHFDGEGNFIPGFCGGVSLGDSRKVIDLVRDGIPIGDYPVLGFLIDDDFEGFLEFAKERGYREPAEGYLSKCHLCIDLRKHLSGTGEYKELKPVEFYRHLD
jgi:hypothetical protein